MNVFSLIILTSFLAAPLAVQETNANPPPVAPELQGLEQTADSGVSAEASRRASRDRQLPAIRGSTAQSLPVSPGVLPLKESGSALLVGTTQVAAGEGPTSAQVNGAAMWPRFPRTYPPGRQDREPLAQR
jgi:hypothetical protein